MHTPGPWGLSFLGDAIQRHPLCAEVRNAAGRLVHRVDLDDLNQEEAVCAADDARLIASAPELLQELIDYHDWTIDQGWHTCEGIPGCPVENVVSKARGVS